MTTKQHWEILGYDLYTLNLTVTKIVIIAKRIFAKPRTKVKFIVARLDNFKQKSWKINRKIDTILKIHRIATPFTWPARIILRYIASCCIFFDNGYKKNYNWQCLERYYVKLQIDKEIYSTLRPAFVKVSLKRNAHSKFKCQKWWHMKMTKLLVKWSYLENS